MSEDEVVPWPTNIVLELNAHEAAVRERFADRLGRDDCETKAAPGPKRYAPGMVIAAVPPPEHDPGLTVRELAQRHGIEVRATEACSLWDRAIGRRDPRGEAQFLPRGLRDATVRAHVEGAASGGWMRVSTLGSLTRTVSTSEWSRTRKAMLNVLKAASEIEIVLVVDSTGSMVREVRDVGRALTAFHEKLVGGGAISAIDTHDLATIHNTQLPELPIRIRVSLLLYSDVSRDDTSALLIFRGKGTLTPRTGYVFKRLSLRNEMNAIRNGIEQAVQIIMHQDGGGREAMFHALDRVITDETLWSDPVLGQQVVVLITDEDGIATAQKNEHSVALGYDTTARRHYGAAREHAREKGYEIIGEELGARSRNLLWGSVIFTEPVKHAAKFARLKRQLKPLEMFGEDRIHEVDTAEHRVFVDAEFNTAIEAIRRAIEDEQIRIERLVTRLERCALDPKECTQKRPDRGVHAAGMVASETEVDKAMHLLASKGMTREQVEREVRTGFVEGFVRLKSPGRRSTWRQAVMVTERQMAEYNRILQGIVYGLNSRVTQNERCDTPEVDLVRLMLFLQDIVEAPPANASRARRLAQEHRHADIDEACQRADLMYSTGLGGTMSEQLGLAESIPVDPKGLFGISFQGLAERIGEIQIHDVLDEFVAKAMCLRQMREGGPLLPVQALDPDDPHPERNCTPDGVIGTSYDWPVRVSRRYGGSYVFIPLELLP